ncbi:hypothetical protein DFH08DRAFT_1041048, partial [Mycena albidolilacea]
MNTPQELPGSPIPLHAEKVKNPWQGHRRRGSDRPTRSPRWPSPCAPKLGHAPPVPPVLQSSHPRPRPACTVVTSAPPHPRTRARGHVPPSLQSVQHRQHTLRARSCSPLPRRSFPVQPPLNSHPPRTHSLLLPDTPRPIGCAVIPPPSCVRHFAYAGSSDTAHTCPRPIPFSSSPMQQCPQNAPARPSNTPNNPGGAACAPLPPSPP